MVDNDIKNIDDFDAAVAHANSVLLQTLDAKDIMATTMLQSPAADEACEKLCDDLRFSGNECSISLS